MSRVRVALAATALALLSGTACVWAVHAAAGGTPRDPVSIAEAQDAFGEIVRASSGGVSPATADEFCAEHAATQTMCRISVGRTEAVSVGLPVGTPEVTFRALADGSVAADVSGTLSVGGPFESSVEFVRDESGEVKAVDPVFWATKDIVDAREGDWREG